MQRLSRFLTDTTISQGGVLDPGKLGQKIARIPTTLTCFCFIETSQPNVVMLRPILK